MEERRAKKKVCTPKRILKRNSRNCIKKMHYMYLRILLKRLKVKACITKLCAVLYFLFAVKYAIRYPYDLLMLQTISSGIQAQLLLLLNNIDKFLAFLQHIK